MVRAVGVKLANADGDRKVAARAWLRGLLRDGACELGREALELRQPADPSASISEGEVAVRIRSEAVVGHSEQVSSLVRVLSAHTPCLVGRSLSSVVLGLVRLS